MTAQTKPTLSGSNQQIYRFSRQLGASSLEILFVVILVLIFVWVATLRIWELRIAAERNAMEYVVGNLKSALGIHVAVSVVKEGLNSVAALDKTNPMQLMDKKPASYIGELGNPDPAQISGYQWYYDRQQQMLIYRVENSDFFESPLSGPARARFQVRLGYTDVNGNGLFDKGIDPVSHLNLISLEPWHWLKEQQKEP